MQNLRVESLVCVEKLKSATIGSFIQWEPVLMHRKFRYNQDVYDKHRMQYFNESRNFARKAIF